MIVFEKIADLQSYLHSKNGDRCSLGFVPTMGALHEGHLSLVRRAKSENDTVVVSIFVNPIQFNNQEDLQKYPRTLDHDVMLLEGAGCDVVFAPSVEEMYPDQPNEQFNFGNLEKVMEGFYRPGHFNGVGVVVKRLFEIVQPQHAYFGEKDYQQLAIIKRMVEIVGSAVKVIPCSIVREPDGLAMSSRNMRLDQKARSLAPKIFELLSEGKKMSHSLSPKQTEKWVSSKFEQINEFSLEYFSIVDANTLQPIDQWDESKSVIACIAVYLGGVRLIDNLMYRS